MRDRIAERSDGIPLYAVETIRTLVDQGRLERSHGRALPGRRRPTARAERPRQPHRPHRGSAGRVDARRPRAGAQPLGARHDLHPLGSRRTLRRGRRGDPRGAALRPGPPRRPVRARRPAVAAARGVPVQPGTAADGRLRHPLQAGAPVAAHRGRRAPAGVAARTRATRSSTSWPPTTWRPCAPGRPRTPRVRSCADWPSTPTSGRATAPSGSGPPSRRRRRSSTPPSSPTDDAVAAELLERAAYMAYGAAERRDIATRSGGRGRARGVRRHRNARRLQAMASWMDMAGDESVKADLRDALQVLAEGPRDRGYAEVAIALANVMLFRGERVRRGRRSWRTGSRPPRRVATRC